MTSKSVVSGDSVSVLLGPPSAKRVKLSAEGGGVKQVSSKLPQPPLSTIQESQIKTEFPLRNLEEFYKTCPTYRLPVEVGSFSLDNKGKHQLNRTQLKYYSPPPTPSRLNFDLKLGYDKYIPSPRSVPSDKLNPILRWIAVNGDCFRPKLFSPKSPDKAEGNGGIEGNKSMDEFGRRISVGDVGPVPIPQDR